MNDEVNVDDEFLYAFQINTSSTYHIKKWDTYITLLYKYNGEQENYVATGTDSEGNSTFSIETIDDYSWLDASVKKSFLADKFLLTIGGRNLLNITSVDIRNSTSNGGTHSGGNNNLLLGYGRSFYIKLLYNLNF